MPADPTRQHQKFIHEFTHLNKAPPRLRPTLDSAQHTQFDGTDQKDSTELRHVAKEAAPDQRLEL
ncbi:hypothetical protein AUEXF2481DRAFT_38835 [Aureobasidium subglaciale EXF-2481]|uniref:Uncharacterized protein n=1 Tax=Aureobasidium subglaciale (strain EXF-2481) TaxID=1043005 RepID=A0A074YKI1_AURSE|nr:uncharacterized protein AUEXF2481DRAFT_38835 [Aureobasidium subglaciale EXF-2481]KEQ96569.1 hypothetical protein AUEXF2481DRAFT_38835 [Aureobasidium subglaciale EXF-2481]